MLNVANIPLILSVIVPDVVMLSVAAPFIVAITFKHLFLLLLFLFSFLFFYERICFVENFSEKNVFYSIHKRGNSLYICKVCSKNYLEKRPLKRQWLILPWLLWVKELKQNKTFFVESKERNETLLMAQVFLLQLLLQKIANVNTTLKCLFSFF